MASSNSSTLKQGYSHWNFLLTSSAVLRYNNIIFRYANCHIIQAYFRIRCLTTRYLNSQTSKAELVMGHFFKTQPNPTQNFWTQPNPTQPTKVFTRPNPTHHRHLVWHIRLYRKLYTTTVLHVTYKFTVNESYYSAAVLISRQWSIS